MSSAQENLLFFVFVKFWSSVIRTRSLQLASRSVSTDRTISTPIITTLWYRENRTWLPQRIKTMKFIYFTRPTKNHIILSFKHPKCQIKVVETLWYMEKKFINRAGGFYCISKWNFTSHTRGQLKNNKKRYFDGTVAASALELLYPS